MEKESGKRSWSVKKLIAESVYGDLMIKAGGVNVSVCLCLYIINIQVWVTDLAETWQGEERWRWR